MDAELAALEAELAEQKSKLKELKVQNCFTTVVNATCTGH